MVAMFSFATAQNSGVKLKHELKVFTTRECFECLVFIEKVLEDPYFQTYATNNLIVTIHHTDSLEANPGIFEKYNSEKIYPTIALLNPYKNDFVRLPFNGMPAEDFVYLISKFRR